MNGSPAIPSWSWTRRSVVVLLVATAQAATVLWFTRWPRLEQEAADLQGQVRLEPVDRGDLWIGDPRQFSGVDPAGFSGAAGGGGAPPPKEGGGWEVRAPMDGGGQSPPPRG
ncbi:MAG: hypothetical protein KIT22_20205, partial [Verrucomicrobiae bacterium]|nr:hypothetical protein [Verrucomicrobiae bacterium]